MAWPLTTMCDRVLMPLERSRFVTCLAVMPAESLTMNVKLSPAAFCAIAATGVTQSNTVPASRISSMNPT